MRCINFDKEFERYITVWMKEHAKEYKNYDAMEAAMPQVYEEFLDTPVNWLSGAKPGEYFQQFDNPKQLVNWMEDYFKQRIPVPDMLMNRISELGLAAEESLMNMMQKEKATQEMKMAAVTLLREIESCAPMQLYIDWQIARTENGEDELADNALESLSSMGEEAVPAMREGLKNASSDGQEALLTLLCNYPGDEAVLETALALFQRPNARIAVIADCLGKLGDERALPLLKDKAASEETEYLDYIELRSAIEALGGEAPEREFDAEDPAYEAMRSMQ
ncbi:MAG: HEAT repeat domain-containing protein [Clostridiales bacterium]|nr:HEAT repeat domain-containing protein [Clostridiales bacterium]